MLLINAVQSNPVNTDTEESIIRKCPYCLTGCPAGHVINNTVQSNPVNTDTEESIESVRID